MAVKQIQHNTNLLIDDDGSGGHRIIVTDGGSALTVQTSAAANVGVVYADNTGNMDAFGRLRVSDPTTLFDSALEYDEDPLHWGGSTNNSGSIAHQPNAAAVTLTVSANDKAVRQTKAYHRYQPGKSQFVLTTFVFSASAAGLEQKIGYFDGNNGIFLESASGVTSVVRRTNVTGTPADNKVAQASWNIDTLDGNGDSGVTIDETKSQIFFLDLEWLGVGRARTGFVIDGKFYYAHEFLNTNNLASVYMSTANLPVRYEAVGGSDLVARTSLSQICAAVMSEGGFEVAKGATFSATNAGSLITAGVNETPVLAIRPAAQFNGITNRATIIPTKIGVFSEDANITYRVRYGADLGGASWQDVDASFSAVQFDIAASVVNGGIVVDTDYVAADNKAPGGNVTEIFSRLPLALDIAGAHPTASPTDVLSITAQRIGATNSDVSATISWAEIK